MVNIIAILPYSRGPAQKNQLASEIITGLLLIDLCLKVLLILLRNVN